MTETESMVVRVAKAIVARDDTMLLGNGITDKEAIAYARAAIEAMREPTDDMLDAMNDVTVDGGEYSISVSFADCAELYKAAFVKALEE